MGKVIRLEVENFKSYARRQIIGPFQNFSAIIGPNGAGKSNIMDAISFVLGVQSAQLRGSQLRDLVYRMEGEPHNIKRRAMVQLVFAPDSDNEDKQLVFQRNILPGGTSEYRINGKVATWERYNDTMKKYNILVKAKNFLVFQGDVEAVASKSPLELTHLIETISGSDELQREFNEFSQAKEKAVANTMFSYQKKKGVTAERKQYKEQKEEAEDFQNQKRQEEELKLESVLFELFYIEQDLQKYETEVTELREEEKEVQQESKHIDSQVANKLKELASLAKSRLRKEKQAHKCAKSLETMQPSLVKNREETTLVVRRLEKSRASLDKDEAEDDRRRDEVNLLKSELDQVSSSKKAYEREMSKQQKGKLKLQDEQMREYTTLKDNCGKEAAALQQQLDQRTRQQEPDRQALDNLSLTKTELIARQSQLGEQKAELVSRRTRIDALVEANLRQADEVTGKLKEQQSKNSNARARQEDLTREITSVNEQLQSARADRRESEREVRFNECLESMKRLFPGVIGRLVDICSPVQTKYNVAITVAMGKNMDAVVVDTEKTGMDCVQYMKEQRSGIATFIPLDKIKASPPNEKLRDLGDGVRLVSDLIQYEANVSKAIQYACGNTLAVDTLAQAKRLCFRNQNRLKVVTLDGTLIRKSGLMTGGLSGVEDRARRWDAKTVDALKSKKQDYTSELVIVDRALRDASIEHQLAAQLDGLKKRRHHLDFDTKSVNDKLTQNEKDQKSIGVELQKLEPRIAKLTEAIETREEAMASIHRDIRRVEDNVFAEFSAKIGVKNIREYEETQLRLTKERAERVLQFNTTISRIQSQIEYETSRDLLEPIKALRAKIAQDENVMKKLQTQLETLQRKESKAKESLQDVNREAKAHLQQEKDMLTEISVLKKEFTAREKDLADLRRKILALDTTTDTLRNRRHEVFQDCRVQEVSLPYQVEGDNDMDPMQAMDFLSSSSQSQSQGGGSQDDSTSSSSSQAMRTQQGREDDVVVDYSSLSRKLKSMKSTSDREAQVDKYQAALKDAASAISRMAPNMRAIDRFEDVLGRLETTKEEFLSARDTSRDAQEKFNAVKQKRTTLFMEAFSYLEKAIDPIYKELTKSDTHPGGTAYLTLENPEEPFLHGIKYTAMPPRKRFHDMEQLSGGEKTVAALALLFAIHGYKPSPFFVLDEVDAALDNANVNKIARYIRTRADDFQCLVISLKHIFYEKADGLVGVYRDQNANSSRTVTLDLQNYAN